jgi:hypothetical protein
MSSNRYSAERLETPTERSFRDLLGCNSHSDDVRTEARRIAAEVLDEVRREREKQASQHA